MSDKKLRIGVIGVGMGNAHIHGYRQHPSAEVVALADLDANRLEAVANQVGVAKRYTSVAKMLAKEKLDIVSVATPNKFHMPLTLQALQAGCHVLCEKPMAMNADEARKMLAAAKKARRRIMVNFSFRFTEQSWALKRQVDAGVLGDVYFARTVWHRRRGMPGFGGWFGQKKLAGGGPLIDLGVHRMDLAMWLMGHPKPVWVLAQTYDHIAAPLAKKSKKAFDVEDLAVAMVRFDNGATMIAEASWAGHIKENELQETRLMGTKAGLVQRNLNESYSYEAEIYLEKDGTQYDMKVHPPVPAAPSSYAHFVDSIVNDRPHVATGEEGLIVMEVIDAIYASARIGAPVKIARR